VDADDRTYLRVSVSDIVRSIYFVLRCFVNDQRINNLRQQSMLKTWSYSCRTTGYMIAAGRLTKKKGSGSLLSMTGLRMR
jgi:hypothetical protein